MSVIFEKEVRGALTKEDALRIDEYALAHHWKKHSYKQISIYCNTDHLEQIGSVNTGRGRLIIDIRDNGIKLKLKLGNALSFDRKEYTIKSTNDSYEAIAVLLNIFGITEGFVRTFERTDYTTDFGIQLTVKFKCLMGDHFELERNSDNELSVSGFGKIINDLNLQVWTKNELAAAIQKDHDKVRAQNIYEYLKEAL